MPGMKVKTEDIVAAYRKTGSVWRVGKLLGLSGQSVWDRLHSIGHPMRGTKWTDDEYLKLREMVGKYTLNQMATTLGRPYGSVAEKISSLGLAGRSYGRTPMQDKENRFDCATTHRLIAELEQSNDTVSRFALEHGFRAEPFIKAIQRHNMEWWEAYVRKHSDLPPMECAYCSSTFTPLTKKQKTCSRVCQAHHRNAAYFGGKRREAVGMDDGVCQLCLQKKERLHAHHVRGKENDPGNDDLTALCPGCHRSLGVLAAMDVTDDAEGWERLICLVMARKLGARNNLGGVHVAVEIDTPTVSEWSP